MQPKVAILDIETSPLVVLVWDIKDQYIRPDQIVKDWDIMAWSAKWLGEPEASRVYYDRRHNLTDKQLLKPLRKLLDTADIVITQNGKKFDSKKINARFILNGITPPSPYKHLDTYVISKETAAFTSHSLDYLTEKLNKKYKKLHHSKFPGLSLWKECLSGKWVEHPWKTPLPGKR
jgi:DNA polymerase elongation subunit (family B)